MSAGRGARRAASSHKKDFFCGAGGYPALTNSMAGSHNGKPPIQAWRELRRRLIRAQEELARVQCEWQRLKSAMNDKQLRQVSEELGIHGESRDFWGV